MAGKQITQAEDYSTGKRTVFADHHEEDIDLPKSNVLKYFLEDGSWFCLRPSGTEPKVKFYFAVKGTSLQDSEQRLAALSEAVMKTVDGIVEKRNKQQTAGSDIRRFFIRLIRKYEENSC